MTKNAARKKAARARATAERSTYARAQRREREAATLAEPTPDALRFVRPGPVVSGTDDLGSRHYWPGGQLRTSIADQLVWARVLRPSVPLVYLDLNHYINLAKASPNSSRAADAASKSGRVLPGYADLAEAAREAKASGRAMFPLSGIHIMEVSRIADPRQRADVAAVMEELSEFNYLLDRPTLTQLEMDAGLDHINGESLALDDYLPLIGKSFAYAFGRRFNLTITDADGMDTSAELRQQLGGDQFDAMLADMNLQTERAMLRGPTDEEIPEMRANGWDPERIRAGHESRLGYELETTQILNNNPAWLTGRLRDFISGREVIHEWLDIFLKHLKEREEDGLAHDLPSTEQMSRFWAAMPQVQVAISMKTRYHRNPTRTWRTNDISDIDAMAIAYPYCDAVFTDREARAALADTPDLRRFGTFLPVRPAELTAWLQDLPPVTNSSALVPHPLVEG